MSPVVASKVPSDEDLVIEAKATGEYAVPLQQAEQLPPDNYMFLAWFSCFFCCWPMGLFAIFRACAVHDHFANGDVERSYEAAKSARNASLVAIVMGIALLVVNIIYNRGQTSVFFTGED